MSLLQITGYQFIALAEVQPLQQRLLQHCESLNIKGTILLSHEGINVNVCGLAQDVQTLQTEITRAIPMITFRHTIINKLSFKRLKVKIKEEIITFRDARVQPQINQAPSISPQVFKQWLDDKEPLLVLDTRNDYEVAFGTFDHALNLKIQDFAEFPQAIKGLPQNKKIVMFCTGGIRCEKAALHLMHKGFTDVYQLEGGILNYFAQIGATHYQGDCFVFDERIAVDANLQATGFQQCKQCQGPIPPDSHCPHCPSTLTN